MKPYKFNNKIFEPEFMAHLFSNNFIPQITLPTRSSYSSSLTLLDNIFTDNQAFCSVSGNMTTSKSDHLPQFIIIENFKDLYETNKGKFSFRKFKKIQWKKLQWRIKKCIDWSLATRNDDLHLQFKKLFHLFNKTLDKHVPMK